jgi:hypothetical protein
MTRFARPEDEIFVLGDDPYAYIALNRAPPPYVSLYNQSLRANQEEQIAWLERRRPRLVLWRPNRALSDGVPEQVRAPLLFAHIVTHYVPESEAGGFQLLRSRAPHEPADLGFFKRWLHDRLDLGFLPSQSGAAKSAGKDVPNRTTVAEFVVVRSHHPIQSRKREVIFDVGEDSFTVEFKEREGVLTYFIRTDRLWFHSLATSNNLLPALRSSRPSDLEVRLETIALAEDVLY